MMWDVGKRVDSGIRGVGGGGWEGSGGFGLSSLGRLDVADPVMAS